VQETHKQGKHARHPEKYNDADWGSGWKRLLDPTPTHYHHAVARHK
jgi:hypothetical protein